MSLASTAAPARAEERPPLQSEDFALLAPSLVEVVSLFALVCAEALLYSAGGYLVVNILGPLGLMGILGFANWRLARARSEAIWTGLFAFRLAAVVFFGAGAILPYVVREETRDYVLSLYSFSDAEACKANLVWAVGTFSTLAGATAVQYVFPRLFTNVKVAIGAESRTLSIGLVFLGLGVAYMLFVELAQVLGLYELPLPGTVRQMFDAINSVGGFLFALWVFRRGGYAYAALALLMVFNIAVGLIALNKTMVVLPMLFIGLAALVDKLTILRVAIVAGSMLTMMSVLQPMVANARIIHVEKYDTLEGGTVEERLGYYVDYLNGRRHPAARTGSDEAFVRLSYLNIATFVISQYDARLPDNSVENAATALIPRVIWPDKPILTQSANELYFMLTGSDGSALSASIFPDLYWNVGWTGLLLLPLLFGMFLLLASRVAFLIVHNRDWLMMPFVLIVFRVGISADGTFVNSLVAPAVMAIVAYLALRWAELALTGRRSDGAAFSKA